MVIFAVPPVLHSGQPTHRTSRLAVALIPARYHSTRLPGKALADIGGRPMIEHVYRRAADGRGRSLASSSRPTIARIADAVRAFGGEVRMTSPAHPSGTDRLAEVAASLTCDLIVNVQGDEPLIAPEMIDEAVAPFAADPGARDEHAAQAHRGRGRAAQSEHHEGRRRRGRLRALLFPRAPIPFTRDGCPPAPAWRHIGLYVYRRDTLLRLAALPPVAIERAEALEQLRALAHGIAHSVRRNHPGRDRRRHAVETSSTCGRWSPRTRSYPQPGAQVDG